MKKSILILDDQVMYGRSLARALGKEYDVRRAVSCSDAKARADYVHIALVDIRLDEADAGNREGLDFIRWLRKQSRDVSIIAMSALEEEDLENKAKEAGANCFLRKPIVVSKLRELLSTFT